MSSNNKYCYPEVRSVTWCATFADNTERFSDEKLHAQHLEGLEVFFYVERPDMHELPIPNNRIRIMFHGCVPQIAPHNFENLFLTRRIRFIEDDPNAGIVTIHLEKLSENETQEPIITIEYWQGHLRVYEVYESVTSYSGLYPPVQSVFYNNKYIPFGTQQASQTPPPAPADFRECDGLVIVFEAQEPGMAGKKLRNNKVRILIDNLKRCCEKWDVKINAFEKLSSLYTKRIRTIKYNCKREKRLLSDEDDNDHCACVDIVCDDGSVIEVDTWCRHNGDYSHQFVLDCHEFCEDTYL